MLNSEKTTGSICFLVLFYFILFYFTLFYFILFYFILFYFILFYFILFYIIFSFFFITFYLYFYFYFYFFCVKEAYSIVRQLERNSQKRASESSKMREYPPPRHLSVNIVTNHIEDFSFISIQILVLQASKMSMFIENGLRMLFLWVKLNTE